MRGDSCKSYIEIWWNGIKSLPETTSIHGFRFIGDRNRHWTERLFWLIFVVLCWYGSSQLISAQYYAYQNYPISFVVETTYKDWDTYFPSVAVCENDNTAQVEAMSDRLFGEGHDFNVEEVLKEISYFKGFTYYITEFCSSEEPLENCNKWNLTHYANLVRSSCEDTISNCTWNGNPFPCCEAFRPMDTELGICYVANSIQIRGKQQTEHKMISNKTTGPGKLSVDIMVPAKVYVSNEEEVPSYTIIGLDSITVAPKTLYRRIISIRNIENDVGARLISPAKRKCRYVDENFLEVYPFYSYTACTVQCRKNAQLKLCNCTNFYIPNVPDHIKCDVNGLLCLNENVNVLSDRLVNERTVHLVLSDPVAHRHTQLSKDVCDMRWPWNLDKKGYWTLRAKWSNRPGLDCDCLPSCTEAEISIVKDFRISTAEDYGTVQIELAALPSERYRRNVVRGFLDLIVSTGGTGGLFLGASLLSFVELFYILLIRPFCDVYSRRGDDPWYRKFGTRRLEDNQFKPKRNKGVQNIRKRKIHPHKTIFNYHICTET